MYRYKALMTLAMLAVSILVHSPVWSSSADQTVPKASCESARQETMQGRTTLAERFAPGPSKAYHCNLELLGQFEGEGSAGYLNIVERCAYFSTWESAKMDHPGVVVLDISDVRHPKPTAYLTSSGMLNANEFLESGEAGQWLYGNRFNTSLYETYDLSKDCRFPTLKRSVRVPGVVIHMGQFTSDFRTLYGASCCKGPPNSDYDQKYPFDPSGPASAVFAVDTIDPNNWRAISTWIPPAPSHTRWATHTVSTSPDDTRVYASINVFPDQGDYQSGVVILDASDIQRRGENPRFRMVSSLFWGDSTAQGFNARATISGKPYLIVTDMFGAKQMGRLPAAEACRLGKPAWGVARLIDISDERHPKVASKLALEVHDPKNCESTMHDPTSRFGYSSMACATDDETDARLLACGYAEAGLRVFDIRDPEHPKEIAYYKPPAARTASRPGSVTRQFHSPELRDHTADDVWFVKFLRDKTQIAFMSTDGGFQIVRFSPSFVTSRPELFQK